MKTYTGEFKDGFLMGMQHSTMLMEVNILGQFHDNFYHGKGEMVLNTGEI